MSGARNSDACIKRKCPPREKGHPLLITLHRQATHISGEERVTQKRSKPPEGGPSTNRQARTGRPPTKEAPCLHPDKRKSTLPEGGRTSERSTSKKRQAPKKKEKVYNKKESLRQPKEGRKLEGLSLMRRRMIASRNVISKAPSYWEGRFPVPAYFINEGKKLQNRRGRRNRKEPYSIQPGTTPNPKETWTHRGTCIQKELKTTARATRAVTTKDQAFLMHRSRYTKGKISPKRRETSKKSIAAPTGANVPCQKRTWPSRERRTI